MHANCMQTSCRLAKKPSFWDAHDTSYGFSDIWKTWRQQGLLHIWYFIEYTLSCTPLHRITLRGKALGTLNEPHWESTRAFRSTFLMTCRNLHLFNTIHHQMCRKRSLYDISHVLHTRAWGCGNAPRFVRYVICISISSDSLLHVGAHCMQLRTDIFIHVTWYYFYHSSRRHFFFFKVIMQWSP